MKNAKKVLALALCAVLLIGASVMGTLAYLNAEATVTNTFTVGDVTLGGDSEAGLDEADVNEYGELLNSEGNVFETGDTLAERVIANEYKLIPGHEYVKDPTIHVGDDSEDCWLFVKLENGLGANATINGMGAKWSRIGDTDYWAYADIVSAGEDVVVFTSFTYAENVEDTTADAAKEIVVTAYAIQADGLETSEDAFDALDLS